MHSRAIAKPSQPTGNKNYDVKLLSNVFSISLDKPKLIVYVYKLSIHHDTDDIEMKFQCKLIGNRIFRKLHQDLTKLINSCNNIEVDKVGSFVIDLNDNVIYTTKELELTLCPSRNFKVQQIIRTLSLSDSDFTKFRIKFTISYDKTIEINKHSLSAKLATSVLNHQLFHNMLRYHQSYFLPDDPSRRRLSLLLDSAIGLCMSGIRNIESERYILSLNKPHAAFTRPENLVEFLKSFYNDLLNSQHKRSKIEPEVDIYLRGPINCNSVWFQKFSSSLFGRKCRVELPNYRLTFRFSNLTAEPMHSIKFFWQDKQIDTGLIDFYFEKYKIKLKYVHLPCLARSTTDHGIVYYPLELCSLIDDKISKVNFDQESEKELTRLSSSMPGDRYRQICAGRKELDRICNNQCDQFGLSLSQEPLQVTGRMLVKPTLLYGLGKKARVTKSYWETGPFLYAANLDNWRVILTTSIDFVKAKEFISNLVSQLALLGFTASNPKFSSLPKENLNRDKLKAQTGLDQLVMFIIDGESTQLHRLIHDVFDKNNHETTAVCVRADSIRYKSMQVIRTLTQKINSRLKGANVSFDNIGVPKSVIDASKLMVIGLDVTHPDSEMKVASISGCAYTYGPDLFRHKSLYGFQRATQELIENPKALFLKLFNDYKIENNETLPKHIIVFRDGVSESQFEKVKQQELSAIVAALKEINQVNPGFELPSLSFVVVQKRHSTRLFGFDRTNKLVNPLSGTIIDKDIVTSGGAEFYLFSHTCNRSTARPTHYRILFNELLSNEQLQQLTYSLCFNFGKCSTSLTIPTTLRYADAVAFEAREQFLAQNSASASLFRGFKSSRFFC